MPRLKRLLYGPNTDNGPSRGNDVVAIKRGLNKVENNFFPRPKAGFDDAYNLKTEDAVEVLRKKDGRKKNGPFRQDDLDALWLYMDAYAKFKYRMYKLLKSKTQIPNLGPVVSGGQSLLDQSLTHKTDDIALFPAVDLAWGAGVSMIAPEDCIVDTKDTSANPGEALYLTGDSGMRYWFAHIDRDYSLGRRFKKGEFLAKTVDTSQGGGPHGHVGVNGEAFLGIGKQFLYGSNGNGPDYTRGAPTIREQLRKVLK